nr:hypothetical protein [Micromonospora sp. DSM 115978]
MNETESGFHAAMLDIYRRALAEVNYKASYFLQMVDSDGGLTTARKLLASQRPSDGFTALWERGRLDLTVEATMLDPRFSSLFSDDELDAARDRLRQYGFRVDA